MCFLLERRDNGRSKVSSGALDFPVDGFPKREKKGDLETLKEEKKRERERNKTMEREERAEKTIRKTEEGKEKARGRRG